MWPAEIKSIAVRNEAPTMAAGYIISLQDLTWLFEMGTNDQADQAASQDTYRHLP